MLNVCENGKEIQAIVKKIRAKKNQIYKDKFFFNNISDYICLKKRYNKFGSKDKIFQAKYCIYYKFRGINNQIGNYFNLMEKKERNLNSILNRLGKDKKVHFSFTTKLIHTLDNSKPIYDKHISEELKLSKPYYNKNIDKRILRRGEIYEELKHKMYCLLSNEDIKKVILEFREKFCITDKEINNLKVLDSIIWSLYNIRRGKAK